MGEPIMKGMLAAVWAVMMVTFGASAMGADYFVSPQGDDGNPGSKEKPFKAIAKATGSARAGDTIHLAPGTYAERIAPAHSGVANAPITLHGDGNGDVVWTTPQAPPAKGMGAALDLNGKSYFTIEGITFKDCTCWITMGDAHHHTVKDCTFDGSKIYNSFWISNGSYIRVLRCRFLFARKQTGVLKDAGWIPEPGADYIEFFRNSHHNLVEGCEFGPITHLAVDFEPFEKNTSPTFNIVRNCVFRNPEWKCISALQGAKYTLVENNVCEGNAALFVHVESDRMILRRNLFLRYRDVTDGNPDITQRGAIRVGGGTIDGRFYHNLFYANQRTITSFNMGQPASGNIWKNNIFLDNAQTVFLGFKEYQTRNRTPFLNNLLRGKAAGEKLIQLDKEMFTLAEAQAKLAELYRGNIEADPMLRDPARDDFHLREGSPCIDAGANLTAAVEAGSGKVISVEDPLYFCDGWGLIDGDVIVVGENKPVRVTKVDYEKKTLEMDREITWKKGDAVNQPYQGKAPDIGPYEFVRP
jgi:hypothetical protein